MKRCIICINASFGNAPSIQKALNCQMVMEHDDYKGFYLDTDKAIYGFENIPKVDHYIFVGSGSLLKIDIGKLTGKKTVIITDSHYLEETEKIDKIIEENNIEVFCMTDKWELCKFPKKVFWHGFVDLNYETKKYDKITICHTPSKKIGEYTPPKHK